MRVKWWHIALVICLAVAFISPLASGSPDVLERVGEDQVFLEHALTGRQPYKQGVTGSNPVSSTH